MASSVATPLEKQFATISGITSISSRSSPGQHAASRCSSISSRDIDAAAQDVQATIARAPRSLPPGMPTPPSFQKANPADAPVFFLALSSATLPLPQVDRYAETVLAQRLSMVTGVAQVNVFGAQKSAVRVDLDPMQLASRQIGIDQVAQAITGANVEPSDRHALRPEPQLRRPGRAASCSTRTAIRPIVVAYRNGSPVRLDEVAHVYDGVENERNASWYNGTRAIYLAIQRQPGTNTVEVVDAIKAAAAGAHGAAAGVDPARDPQRPLGVDSRVGRRRQVHAACSPSCWSSWSSSCSCGTCRRRSSPAWRCRSRSSARSR